MYWRKRFDNKTRKNVSVNHNSVIDIQFLSFIKKKNRSANVIFNSYHNTCGTLYVYLIRSLNGLLFFLSTHKYTHITFT